MTQVTLAASWGQGLLVWQSPVSFVLGVVVTYFYYRWKAHRMTEHVPGFKRAWLYGLAAAVVFCAIGWNTQRTATNQEHLATETRQFAVQTNDCLNQLIGTLKDRTAYNDEIAKVNDRRAAVTNDLIVGLARVPVDQPQAQTQAQTQAIIEKYLADSQQVSKDNDALYAGRATKPYPDPSCGAQLPGQ